MTARRVQVEIAATTFAILALELSVIRWMSQQVRMFAYLNNLVLIGTFLGMGAGVALGARRERWFDWTLPSLAVLSAVLAFSGPLHLMHLSFPDLSVFQWDALPLAGGRFAFALGAVLVLFGAVVWVFLCAGTKVGALFGQLAALDAYSADLFGSLLGVIAITALSAARTPPPVWFAVASLPLLLLSRRMTSLIGFLAVIVLTAMSIRGALFSPYNRIDLVRDDAVIGHPLNLSVNRDFHQFVHNLSPAAVRNAGPDSRAMAMLDFVYRLPFIASPRKDRALIVGAGTGNDAAAAFRNGFKQVVSVDIDPVIVRIGRDLHPEHPYSNPGSTVVVNDARAYFEQNPNEMFDVICYGLLDSHAMFSAMSTLRLDNFVYTVEGVRAAWRHVRPGGILSISFSTYAGEWISDRMIAIVTEATGIRPVVVDHHLQFGRMFIVGKNLDLRRLEERLPVLHRDIDLETVVPATDDWPFLYIRPGTFPYGYVVVILFVAGAAFFLARTAFGATVFSRARFQPAMFCLGAAFLLIETRGVTDLSLLLGSTWIVNSVVFGGILLVALVSNAVVRRMHIARPELVAIPLVLALVLNYLVRPSMLLGFPFVTRAVLGGILNALPVAFAGVIFSALLARMADSSAALGSNLLGAVAGGCAEYLSMVVGLRALILLALVLYLTAVLFIAREVRSSISSLVAD